MDRTEDILSICSIKPEHITEVVKLRNTMTEYRYQRDKQQQFRYEVSKLTPEGLWLLTFTVWVTKHNPRLRKVQESNFYTIDPAENNNTEFLDFVKILQVYSRKVVKSKNEIHLIKFLSNCDRFHYDFYLSLLAKTFTDPFPTADMYDVLDLGTIDLQEIYGYIEMLHTSFSDLTFPVSIMPLEDPDYKLSVFAREPSRTFSYYQNEGKLNVTRDILTTDAKFINTPRFTLIGYSDTKKIQHKRKVEEFLTIIPLDYFDTFKEFRAYVKGNRKYSVTDYRERMKKLQRFLDSNYTRQVIRMPRAFAENESELLEGIFKLCPDKGSGYIVFTDKDTARTGKAFAVPVMNTYGVIDSIWVQDGVPKGFNIWFNGKCIKCPFSFEGENNTLLNNVWMVHEKMLEFTYMRLGKTNVYIGRRIDWEKIRWKTYRHKGIQYVEKCALCGGTDTIHKRQGICNSCEQGMKHYYENFGVNVWIPATKMTRRKRLKSGWHYKMLENLNVIYRDSYVVARENGDWQFKWAEERAEKYKELLVKMGIYKY